MSITVIRRCLFRSSVTDNMVFTQGRGFVAVASFGLLRLTASMMSFGSPRRGHRLFGNVASFW